jgi:hypothetical protein
MQVINTLIQQGMLSTEGPITDRDVRTMVYVAFTSNELRKLILAGGTPDGVTAADLDLGPVELFDETRYAPLPKTIYTGKLSPSPATESADVIDISTSAESDDSDLDQPLETTPPLPTPKHIYRRVGVDATVDG